MKSNRAGKHISKIEVLNISKNGFWIMVSEKEYFLSFKYFPWFKNARISEILSIKAPSPTHLYWPKLDVDLGLDTIEHPEKYPLVDSGIRMSA